MCSQVEAGGRALRSSSPFDREGTGDACGRPAQRGRQGGNLGTGCQGRQCFKEDAECLREGAQQRPRETQLCRGRSWLARAVLGQRWGRSQIVAVVAWKGREIDLQVQTTLSRSLATKWVRDRPAP